MAKNTTGSGQDQGYTQLRTLRYERKFLVEDLRPFQVQALIRLHPAMFHAPYPPRHINNLYFDTRDLEHYYDNVNGAAQRKKVRVRWYGEPFGEITCPILEVKLKDGLVGTKHSYPLAGFTLDGSFCTRSFRKVLDVSDLPEEVRHGMRDLEAVLFNRYYREYHATRDGRFRCTLDTGLTFYRINGALCNLFAHRQTDYRVLVVELKYEAEQEPHASRVAGFFPFPVTRSSKYVQGMERVYF